MRIALLGGSFDPPHVGHGMVVAYLLLQKSDVIDQIWALPCWDHAEKSDLAPFPHRFQMTELAFQPFGDRVDVHDAEAHYRTRYTRDLVASLKRDYPAADFSLVVGADVAAQIPTWENSEGLLEMANLIVVSRCGYANPDGDDGIDWPAVSSTDIRHYLDGGLENKVRTLVPPAVLRYIRREGLYRPRAT